MQLLSKFHIGVGGFCWEMTKSEPLAQNIFPLPAIMSSRAIFEGLIFFPCRQVEHCLCACWWQRECPLSKFFCRRQQIQPFQGRRMCSSPHPDQWGYYPKPKHKYQPSGCGLPQCKLTLLHHHRGQRQQSWHLQMWGHCHVSSTSDHTLQWSRNPGAHRR